jgi:hypothetical protein
MASNFWKNERKFLSKGTNWAIRHSETGGLRAVFGLDILRASGAGWELRSSGVDGKGIES